MTQAELANLAALILGAINQPKSKSPAIKSKIKGYKPRLSPAVTITQSMKMDGTNGKVVNIDPKIKFEIAVTKGFMGRGFKRDQIALRSDGTNGILTYKGWLKAGRIVKKGERGIKGCFHYDQTQAHVVDKAAMERIAAEYDRQHID